MKGYSEQLISPRYKEITDRQEEEKDKETWQQKRKGGLGRDSVFRKRTQETAIYQDARGYNLLRSYFYMLLQESKRNLI